MLVYHYWPEALPGGYIGVDVFFAISGFLITSLLIREIDRTGRISLTGFWARRARRILPASLLVLFAAAVATAALVPAVHWEHYFGEIRASTVYTQNWHLADTAVDYFAAERAPSPVRHYWSLSAEEQFYLVWPVLLIGALALGRGPLRHGHATIAAAMAVLVGASLVFGLIATPASPANAFYITPTRAWEFGAGGLLALVPAFAAPRHSAWAVLSWVGLVAIGIASFVFSDATSFPGYAALLPIAGTLLVIRAGMPARRWSPGGLMKLRPIQFFGDVSYSLYLWHWPLLIFAPFVIGAPADDTTKVVIAMLTILLAWLSKILVEDPLRFGTFLVRRRARWTFGFSAAATAVVVSVSTGELRSVQAQVAEDGRMEAAFLASTPACFGAPSRDPDTPCRNPDLRLRVIPTPAAALNRPNAPCTFVSKNPLIPVCAFGVSARRATATVALMGDSHAGHWRAALAQTFKNRKWRGYSLVRSGCPYSKTRKTLREPLGSQCVRRNKRLPAWFAKHKEIETVFVTARAGGDWDVPKSRSYRAQVAGYIAAWRALPATVKRIIVIRDNPWAREDTATCIARAMKNKRPAGTACAVRRTDAIERDAAAAAARRVTSGRVQTIDLTRYFCDARRCYPVIGGALVHKDGHHLTVVFARTLGPYLEAAINRLVPVPVPVPVATG